MSIKTFVVTVDTSEAGQDKVAEEAIAPFMKEYSHMVVKRSANPIRRQDMVIEAMDRGILPGELLLFFAGMGIDQFAQESADALMSTISLNQLAEMMVDRDDIVKDLREAFRQEQEDEHNNN